MIEFWSTLNWPQALVLVLLGIPTLIFLFFIFGGEISIGSEGKEPDKKDK